MAKRCTKCNQEYPANKSFFNKDKTKKDGYYSSCKKCRIKETKRYRDGNKDKIRAANKKWQEENKDYMKKYHEKNRERERKYREDHKEDHKEHYEEYRKKNKDKIYKQIKKWQESQKYEGDHSYRRIHKIIEKLKPKSKVCESCNIKNKQLILSFNHDLDTYTLNPNDYIYVCYDCHNNKLGWNK